MKPTHPIRSNPKQCDFLAIPEAPLVYWLRPKFFEYLRNDLRLKHVANVLQGLATADDNRCLRFVWEVQTLTQVEIVDNSRKSKKIDSQPTGTLKNQRFTPFVKGGGKSKWCGYDYYECEWEHAGARIRARSGSVVRNEHGFLRPHYTYCCVR